MFAPAATPRPVLEALHKAAVAALTSDAAKDALTKQGFNIAPSKSLDDARTWLAERDRGLEDDHQCGEDRDGVI